MYYYGTHYMVFIHHPVYDAKTIKLVPAQCRLNLLTLFGKAKKQKTPKLLPTDLTSFIYLLIRHTI